MMMKLCDCWGSAAAFPPAVTALTFQLYSSPAARGVVGVYNVTEPPFAGSGGEYEMTCWPVVVSVTVRT